MTLITFVFGFAFDDDDDDDDDDDRFTLTYFLKNFCIY